MEIKPKCVKCNDMGYIEYHDLDGTTIYKWQKLKKRKCECCK